MEDKKKTVKKSAPKLKSYPLIADFPTKKKHYKAGDQIETSLEGAEYLRKINKIK